MGFEILNLLNSIPHSYTVYIVVFSVCYVLYMYVCVCVCISSQCPFCLVPILGSLPQTADISNYFGMGVLSRSCLVPISHYCAIILW